jgi:hypothetical protein
MEHVEKAITARDFINTALQVLYPVSDGLLAEDHHC